MTYVAAFRGSAVSPPVEPVQVATPEPVQPDQLLDARLAVLLGDAVKAQVAAQASEASAGSAEEGPAQTGEKLKRKPSRRRKQKGDPPPPWMCRTLAAYRLSPVIFELIQKEAERRKKTNGKYLQHWASQAGVIEDAIIAYMQTRISASVISNHKKDMGLE